MGPFKKTSPRIEESGFIKRVIESATGGSGTAKKVM